MNTKTTKKHAILEGNVISPLIIGQRIAISNNGQTILTSPLAAVHEISEQRITIETRNTFYYIVPVHSMANVQ